MAIRARATGTSFLLRNTGRETATPPIVFPPVTPTNQFSYSFWVKAENRIPFTVCVHSGLNGSQVVIFSDGDRWAFATRNVAAAFPTQYFGFVTVGAWTLICVAKDGPVFHVYLGVEDLTIPNPFDVPITVTHTLSPPVNDIDFGGFDYFMLITTSNSAICNLKFWNELLDKTIFEAQSQRWDATNGGVGSTPFWASTLRTPGDLSNIAYPYASRDWDHGHAYTQIFNPDNLDYVTSPSYMSQHTPCPTWVYPVTFPNSNFNPVTTPAVTTTYKAPQFVSFQDRGSVSPLDFQINSIQYYGLQFGTGVGVDARDTWGLFRDENGTEINPAFGDPANRFEQDTVVEIPGGIKASTMYLWKFGAQFTWAGQTPAVPTDTAFLAYMMLLVVFTGYPTGIPQVPVEDLTGLFMIKKGQTADTYNRGAAVKIPQPTIRTAYIGE